MLRDGRRESSFEDHGAGESGVDHVVLTQSKRPWDFRGMKRSNLKNFKGIHRPPRRFSDAHAHNHRNAVEAHVSVGSREDANQLRLRKKRLDACLFEELARRAWAAKKAGPEPARKN